MIVHWTGEAGCCTPGDARKRQPLLWLSGRPPGAVAWIGNTKGTVKPSKTSMSIRWSAMLGSVYAAIPRGREPGDENAGHQ
jgi:hypothetical protein